MGKTLLNKIAKGAEVSSLYSEEPTSKYGPIRRALMAIPVAFSVLAGVGACKPYVIPEEPPTVSGRVNPAGTQVPATLNIITSATDVNDNIADYSVFAEHDGGNGKEDADENVVPPQSSPINGDYMFDKTGTFDFYVKVTDDAGNETIKKIGDNLSFTATPEPPAPTPDRVDVVATIKDTEAKSTARTIARFYDASDSDVIAGNYLDSDILKTAISNTGNISTTLDQSVAQLPSGVVMRVRQSPSDWNNGTSYVTTERFPQGDVNAGTIWTVPFDNPNDSYDDGLLSTSESRTNFRTQVGRENVWSDAEKIAAGIDGFVNGNPVHGLKKVSFSNGIPEDFQGIEIPSTIFNATEYQTIKSVIESSGYFPQGTQISITNTDTHYHNGSVDTGWGRIFRSLEGDGPHTILWDNDANGYIDNFAVYLNTSNASIAMHEGGYHGFGANAGHSNSATVTELFPSMGRYQSPYPSTATAFNKKMNYMAEKFPGMKPLDEMLGLN